MSSDVSTRRRTFSSRRRRLHPKITPLLIHIIEVHTRNLMWGLMRPDDALEHGRLALRRLEDHPAAAELVLNEAMLLTYSGRPLEIVSLLESVPPLVEPRARVDARPCRAPGSRCHRSERHRCRGGARRVRRAASDPRRDRARQPRSAHDHADVRAGGVRAACAMPASSPANAYDATAAVGSTRRVHLAVPTAREVRVADGTGRHGASMACGSGGALRCSQRSSGPRRLVLSELAVAAAWAGDTSAAVAAAADVARLPPFGFSPSEQELGPAWALAAQGDLPASAGGAAGRGRRRCGRLDTEALRRGSCTTSSRLGDPESVVDRLEELGELCEGELVPAYAMHAAAAAAGRGQTLLEAAECLRARSGRSSSRLRPRLRPLGRFSRQRRRAGGGGDRGAGRDARRGVRGCAHACPRDSRGCVASDRPRARHRDAGGPRHGEQGDRRSALLVRAHRQQPPAERVLQARRRRSTRTRCRARRRQRERFRGVLLQSAQHHRLRREVVGEPPGLLDLTSSTFHRARSPGSPGARHPSAGSGPTARHSDHGAPRALAREVRSRRSTGSTTRSPRARWRTDRVARRGR